MAGANSSTLIKVALFGGAGFLAYRYFLAPHLAGGSTTGGSTTGGSTTGGSTTGGSTTGGSTTGGSTTGGRAGVGAALFDSLTKAATAAGWSGPKTPDEFNYLMVRAPEWATLFGTAEAPDPIAVFGNRNPMTLAQYWASMAAYLSAHMGLTGLGVYAGLGRLAFRGGR